MRVADGRYFFLLNSGRLGASATGSTGSSQFADAHPEAAVVGPRLREHRRDAAALGARRADALAARDRVPLHPQARAALAAAEPALRRRLRPRRGARRSTGSSAPALLVRREAADAVGPLRRGLLHVQRGGRLDDALPPRRLEGARSSRAPRSCTSAAPRTAARCTSRTCAGICGSSPSIAARGRPSARAACCSRRCGCARSSAAATRRVPRGRRASSPSGDARTLLEEVIDYLRLAFGTLVRPRCPGWAVARALGQRSVSARARVGDRRACSSPGRSSSRCTARSTSPSSCSALIFVGRAASRDRVRAHRVRRASRARAPWLARRRRARLGCSGTSRAPSPATASSTRRACASSSTWRRCTCAPSTSSRTAGSIPGYAFPLWHGFLALVSWFSGVDPGVVVRHEPSLLAPLACRVAWEAGVAVFGSRWAGSSLARRARSRVFCFGPGHGGSYASLALPATAARQLLVPAGDRALLRRVAGAAAPRSPPSSARSRSLHPTYALFLLVPLAAFALLRAREWRDVRARARRRRRADRRSSLLWLRPIVDETVSHDPGPGERAARARSTTATSSWCATSTTSGSRPRSFGRSGAVAVAALLLLPLAALALRRRWAAFALGGHAARARC